MWTRPEISTKQTRNSTKKLVIDNLTKNYKIKNDNLIDTINSDSKKIILERKIKNNKIPKYTNSDAFVTIKDHKTK